MASNRVELWGRLLSAPELRVTPGGLPILRLNVACGRDSEELVLGVTITGQQAREAAAGLGAGDVIYVAGRLRAVARHARSGIRTTGIEVIANEIKPWTR